MRWFKELMTPACKCERLGHKSYTEWRKGYVSRVENDIWSSFHVAYRVRQERRYCARCKIELASWETVEHKGLNSFSSSADTWEAVKAGGYWTGFGSGPTIIEIKFPFDKALPSCENSVDTPTGAKTEARP